MNFNDYLKRNKKSSLISKGLKLDENFWNNFNLLLNNSEEFSFLLDVPKQKVITWKKKINDAIEEHKNETKEINLKKRIIKTGNTR
jgi:hypothetical protein